VRAIEEGVDAHGHHTTSATLGDGSVLPFGALVWSAGLAQV
jgi:hypothetical protein